MKENTAVFVLMILLITEMGRGDGYLIADCDLNNGLRFDEFWSTAAITCREITDRLMFWLLTRPDGTEVTIARCGWPRPACYVDNSEWYSVTRTSFYTSVLKVKKNYRSTIAGVVRCEGIRGREDGASCKVQVYSEPNFLQSVTSMFSSKWTMSKFHKISRAYTSDGEYKCLWNLAGKQVNGTYTSMTEYMDNGTYYVRGECSVVDHPLPTADGNYTYILKVLPAHDLLTYDSKHTITLRRPTTGPFLLCCPHFIEEGDNVTCRCEAAVGSYLASVIWTNGGEWNDPLLVLNNVSYELHGKAFTCAQYWGGFAKGYKRTVTYVLRVKPANTTVSIIPANTNTTTTTTVPTTSTTNNDFFDQIVLTAVGVMGGVVAGTIGTAIALLLKGRIRKRGATSSDKPKYSKTTPTPDEMGDTEAYSGLTSPEHTACPDDKAAANIPMQEV